MKTITAIFKFDGVVEAKAVGRFDECPGDGAVVWVGDTRRIIAALPPPWNSREHLPTLYRAEQFEATMNALAETSGASLLVQQEGEWESHEE